MYDRRGHDYADQGRRVQSVIAARRALGVAVLGLSLGSLLAGCGMSSVTSGLGTSIFGSGSTSSAAPSAVTEQDLLAAAKTGGEQAAVESSPGCPRFVITPKDAHLTVYEPGRVGDGLAIMHRGELTRTARECTIEGTRVTVRYGFSGRVLLGPRGKSGPLSLPIQVYIQNSNRDKVTSERLRVDATVAVENPIGYFSAVRTLTFEVPEGARAGEFEVEVGFERTLPNSG